MADATSTADVLRPTDDSSSPSAPPPTSETTPLQGFTGSLGLIPAYQAAGAKEAATLRASVESRRADVADLRSLTDAQDVERKAAIPKTPTLPTPPDVSARPFLTPGPGVMNQMQTMLTGITQMVMGAGGLRGNGHAIAAVSALKGALQGWQEGDQERAKNELTNWRTNSEKLQQDYVNRLASYRDILTDQKRAFSERLAEIGIKARIDQDEATAAAAERQQIGDLISIFSKRETEAQHFGIQIATLQKGIDQHAESMATIRRGQDMTDARTRQMMQDRMEDRRQRDQDRLDLSSVKGGPWVDKRTGEIVDRLTNAEWKESEGNKNYKPITKMQMQTIDILKGEAMPQIDQLERLGMKVLAKYPGQNLVTLVQNEAKGKLSDSDVREYNQARIAAVSALGRAFTGSPTLRKFIFDQLEKTEVANVGDTQQTMRRMAENTRVAVVNFTRSAKGWEPFALPSSPRTVEGVNAKGEIAHIKLNAYEPLPEGWQYRF